MSIDQRGGIESPVCRTLDWPQLRHVIDPRNLLPEHIEPSVEFDLMVVLHKHQHQKTKHKKTPNEGGLSMYVARDIGHDPSFGWLEEADEIDGHEEREDDGVRTEELVEVRDTTTRHVDLPQNGTTRWCQALGGDIGSKR